MIKNIFLADDIHRQIISWLDNQMDFTLHETNMSMSQFICQFFKRNINFPLSLQESRQQNGDLIMIFVFWGWILNC